MDDLRIGWLDGNVAFIESVVKDLEQIWQCLAECPVINDSIPKAAGVMLMGQTPQQSRLTYSRFPTDRDGDARLDGGGSRSQFSTAVKETSKGTRAQKEDWHGTRSWDRATFVPQNVNHRALLSVDLENMVTDSHLPA